MRLLATLSFFLDDSLGRAAKGDIRSSCLRLEAHGVYGRRRDPTERVYVSMEQIRNDFYVTADHQNLIRDEK
jgi:hypothetical protein